MTGLVDWAVTRSRMIIAMKLLEHFVLAMDKTYLKNGRPMLM